MSKYKTPNSMVIQLKFAFYIIAFFSLVLLVSECAAQSALIIYKNDGFREQVSIIGSSEKQIFTSNKSIKISDVDSVKLATESQTLINRLRNAGINVAIDASFLNEAGAETTTTKPVSPIVLESNLVQDDPLRKFKNQRDAGKILQLSGAAALCVYFILAKSANDQIKKGDTPDEVPDILPVVGAGLMTVGLMIDLSAGTHLKVRLKK